MCRQASTFFVSVTVAVVGVRFWVWCDLRLFKLYTPAVSLKEVTACKLSCGQNKNLKIEQKCLVKEGDVLMTEANPRSWGILQSGLKEPGDHVFVYMLFSRGFLTFWPPNMISPLTKIQILLHILMCKKLFILCEGEKLWYYKDNICNK